jgi:hypothetical protein
VKTIRLGFVIVFLALFVTLFCVHRVDAALTASDIATAFNGLNEGRIGGSGFHFNHDPQANASYYDHAWGVLKLYNHGDYTPADLSAYRNGVLSTFCIQPNIPIIPEVGGVKQNYDHFVARLNYSRDNNDPQKYITKTTNDPSGDKVLKVGAAFLYKEFVLGNLDYLWDTSNPDYNPVAGEHYSNYVTFEKAVRDAIRYILGYQGDVSGYNTPVLYRLIDYLTERGIYGNYENIWSQVYYLNEHYDWMVEGNDYYYVFVMDVFAVMNDGSTLVSQDFLYLAKAEGTGEVPEPATILLWTIGSTGAICYARKRSGRKNVVA